MDVLARIVEIGPDLLDDDGSLRLYLVAPEVRPDDELAEHVHASRRLAHGHSYPVDRRLTVGSGVEAAADALDRLRHGSRSWVCRRPLEGDVLHEMRRARLFGRLEARSRQDVGGYSSGHVRAETSEGRHKACGNGTGRARRAPQKALGD